MSIFRNLKRVVTGTMLSQVIAIASLPIVAKLYSPESLGFYAFLLSVVSIMGMTSSLRLERGLFRDHGGDGFDERLINTCCISLIFSFLFSCVFLILNLLNVFEVSFEYVILVFIWGFGTSLIQIMVVSNSAIGDFGRLATSTVSRSLALLIFQIILSFFLVPEFSLVLSALLSVYICVAMLSNGIKINSNQIRPLDYLRNNISDSYNGFLQSAFSSFNNNLALMLISQFWGFKAAGLFLIAEKLVRIPINVISNNLRQVVAKHFQDKNNVTLKKMSVISAFSFSFSFIFCILVYFFVEPLIEFILGDDWNEVTNLVKILSLWVVSNFIALPFQSYNLHYIEMRYTTIIEFFCFALKAFSLTLAYRYGFDIYFACFLIVFVSFVHAILNILVSFFKLNKVYAR